MRGPEVEDSAEARNEELHVHVIDMFVSFFNPLYLLILMSILQSYTHPWPFHPDVYTPTG